MKYLLAGAFLAVATGLCRFIVKAMRRHQYNKDQERIKLSMRPNEAELKASQNWYAMEALKVYSKPKKELKNGTL